MGVATVEVLLKVWAEYASPYMQQKLCLLVKDRNDVVTHKCVFLVVVGERHESLQKMLPRNEVAGCLNYASLST